MASGSSSQVVEPEGMFPISQMIENPPERTKTTITPRVLLQLCTQFGIADDDVRLPGKTDFADHPPSGFITVNRQMCQCGVIPPFNPFLATLLRRLAISPSQLHPNGYAIIMGLCVLFMRTYQRFPSFKEICYLCTFGTSHKDHTSILYAKGTRNRRLIMDLPESAHGFLSQYFYVKCPAGFYGIWSKAGEAIS